MDEKHDDADAQLCGHCGQKQQNHWLANYADGPHVGEHFLVCPTATWASPSAPAVTATAPAVPAIAPSALWALVNMWQAEVNLVTRRLPAVSVYDDGYVIAKLECTL